jgi:putative tryptophan/tyrosine transport system substrate-binding protein
MKLSSSARTAAALLAGALLLTGCGAGSGSGGSSAGAGNGSDKPLQIGISQIVDIDPLNATRESFIQALNEHGYPEGKKVVYDYQNAQGDQATATQIAAGFATGKDLVLAISTLSAQTVSQAVTNTPVVFSAVTEPAKAGIVASWDKPGANVTGTSNLGPVEKQIGLVKDLAPHAKSVGVVYSSGEVNSQVQVDLAKQAAAKLGLEVKERAVSSTSEVQQAAKSLDVDALYIPTDAHVVSALDTVVDVAESRQIPLIVGDGASVANGGIATYGVDYKKLGYQTGLMAIKVLEGADPATMPVETLKESQLIINQGAAKRMGITVPQKLLDAADQVIK